MVKLLSTSTVFLAMVLSAAPAQAESPCSNRSLQGQYAFNVQGANVGVYDATGSLHPFAAPLLVTGVGQFTFDGNGSFTRIDYNMGNGVPSINAATPLTANGFRTGQTGQYAIAPDCTGTLHLTVPGVRQIVIALALVRSGERVFGVVAAEHAFSLPAAILPPNVSCMAGCDLGDNILLKLTRNAKRDR